MEINNKSGDLAGFLALYGELNDILDSGCENIFLLMLNRSKQHSIELLGGNYGPWIRDSDLLSKLVTLKGLAELVSRSCTKLTIIVTKTPSEVNLISILREMSDQVSSFIGSYMVLTDCSIGNPFFVLLSTKVRGELLQVRDLVSVLSKGALLNANSATGMVWKTCENVQMIPLSNKAAYRRHIMEKISTVKDTIREFEEYLNVSKSRLDGMMERLNICDETTADVMNIEDDNDEPSHNDDDEEEDEMDDEETTYLESEYPIVEQSISLMEMTQDALKTGLAVMTTIADMFSRASDPQPVCDAALSSSSLCETAPSSTTATEVISDSQIEDYSCDQWVSDISRLSEVIESAVTDFGAELYPPLTEEDTDKLRENGQKLLSLLESYVQLLEKKSKFENESKTMTDTIQQKVCTLSGSFLFNKKT